MALQDRERKVGNTAATRLRGFLRLAIARTTDAKTGEASKANANARYKDNRLQRISMSAPHYIFKQHYGFEGTKKNGVHMRLKATGVINMALQNSNILENLAEDIADIRGEEVISKFNF